MQPPNTWNHMFCSSGQNEDVLSAASTDYSQPSTEPEEHIPPTDPLEIAHMWSSVLEVVGASEEKIFSKESSVPDETKPEPNARPRGRAPNAVTALASDAQEDMPYNIGKDELATTSAHHHFHSMLGHGSAAGTNNPESSTQHDKDSSFYECVSLVITIC
ncbi:hypothetical protein GJ744_003951 [Endocarpon pusillum]|uniref:Uncharacterized protein n=1 Tax=Endocarpon pusillum TaxID=364733 RepID=A0A8H7ADP6_9EURO|nr:hypothetical protein GJ744_003951 [Endocarpon pusillum]